MFNKNIDNRISFKKIISFIYYIKMLPFIALSGIALAYIFYKNFNKDSQNNLDKKIIYYEDKRCEIDDNIEDYENKIEEMKEERKIIDGKMTTLLTKKIISFHKDHKKYNEKSVKKIKHLINIHGEGNKEIEDKVYANIDTYIDVQQVKECEVSDNNSDFFSSDVDDDSSEYSVEDVSIDSESENSVSSPEENMDDVKDDVKDDVVKIC